MSVLKTGPSELENNNEIVLSCMRDFMRGIEAQEGDKIYLYLVELLLQLLNQPQFQNLEKVSTPSHTDQGQN